MNTVICSARAVIHQLFVNVLSKKMWLLWRLMICFGLTVELQFWNDSFFRSILPTFFQRNGCIEQYSEFLLVLNKKVNKSLYDSKIKRGMQKKTQGKLYQNKRSLATQNRHFREIESAYFLCPKLWIVSDLCANVIKSYEKIRQIIRR